MKPLSLANQFLIAMPNMADPLFARALVYLCEHSENGALGMIVNKPSGIAMAQLFEQIDLPLEHDEIRLEPVYFGGPVQPDRGFVLHSPVGNWQSSLLATDEIAMTTSKDVLVAVSEGRGPDKMLVTLGYAGWSAGQLEDELANNGWLTVDADPAIIFGLPPEIRYDSAMALLGFDPARLSGEAGHA
ncbi:MAG TPA: YqgE/AlgH family protein [Chromobacteriaceae bacterium]|nr:YqgE/AlgH family protein [Chromobacteriaceae bacterium]